MASAALRGSLALVTGAGSGIGRATALAFARAGARVLCVDLDAAAAQGTAAGCAELGAEAAADAVDVGDVAAMQALAARVHREHGVLDVLVNNAGVGMSARFAAMSLDDWRWIRSVNLDGVVHGCHAFGPAMVERGRGHVVNVSSGLGYMSRATEPAYVTTKAGVLALSLCLRADWRRHGVGVSAICPGLINTPIIDRARFLGDQADGGSVDRTKRLFRRGHSPDKVAAAILRAIRKDRALVPVGAEAWIGWFLHRWVPLGIQQLIACQPVP